MIINVSEQLNALNKITDTKLKSKQLTPQNDFLMLVDDHIFSAYLLIKILNELNEAEMEKVFLLAEGDDIKFLSLPEDDDFSFTLPKSQLVYN
jgi:hypothetical protein